MSDFIGNQLVEQLRYAERMRDEYKGKPGMYVRLHADWLIYIAAQRERIYAYNPALLK